MHLGSIIDAVNAVENLRSCPSMVSFKFVNFIVLTFDSTPESPIGGHWSSANQLGNRIREYGHMVIRELRDPA
jgi:hypothetical protein